MFEYDSKSLISITLKLDNSMKFNVIFINGIQNKVFSLMEFKN